MKELPTLRELEETQQQLLQNITDTEKLYGADSKEFRLIGNALKNIEEMIDAHSSP